MALKKKLKSFISDIRESTGRSPEEELAPSQIAVSPAVAKFKEHLNHEATADPSAAKEILDSIEEVYYRDETFDTSEYELKKLPETLSMVQIDEDRKCLRNRLQSVCRRVSELVLENHPAYATELHRVMELEQQLQRAQIVCANSRRQLSLAEEGFTTASLGLLSNYRKRQQLIALLKSLRTINTLQRTDIRLREMLEEEDYPGAIQLCLECQKAASTFRHYSCISDLSSKLSDTLEMMEEALDVALSRTCSGFNVQHYQRLHTAYSLLGKTQTAMDQLHMHFASAIHNTAFTKVLGYVELCSSTPDSNFQKRQYVDLCKNITPEVFTPCLLDLCKALWEVMNSFYQVMQWHIQHDEEAVAADDTPAGGDVTSSAGLETSLNRRYIRQKLQHGLGRIWGDVQQKVKTYLLSSDLSYFKYEEFIRVLDIVNRLMEIGKEFCGSESEALQDSIRRHSVSYFSNYHRARLDELRMFLENEAWELCPVKPSFSILMLQEFRFLRHKSNTTESGVDNSEENNGTGNSSSFFNLPKDGSTPFDMPAEEDEGEDVMDNSGLMEESTQRTFSQDTDSEDDIPDELKRDYIDEQTGEIPVKKVVRRRKSDRSGGKMAPIVTNTTLNVCRLIGRYMQMVTVLKPIAFDVIICMSQLFDYYLYTVYSFFATDLDMEEVNERCLSSKLRTTLKRIRDNLIRNNDGSSPSERVAHPHLSAMVSLAGREDLHGLTERLVATESLIFLAETFEQVQPQLESSIPSNKKAFLQQFFSQTVVVARELRQPVYRTVAARSINYDDLLLQMASVRWDVHDLMSQHSPYVDGLLQELERFGGRLEHVAHKVPVPVAVSDVLWEHCIRLANRTFVEGYASAKKCSNEGRALMQLDFQQFLLKLEKLTTLRPIPDREYVEAYVKAYYLPETQLEIWLRDHKEYTSRQQIALVTCVGHINKKMKQKLTNMVEEIDRTRR